MTISTELLTVAKIMLDFDSAVVLVNNTQKVYDVTVPTGKRWFVMGGFASNGDDVNRNLTILWNDGTNTIGYIRGSTSLTAGAVAMFPNTLAVATSLQFPPGGIPMDAGYIIRFTFAAGGASTGGNSTVSLFGLEIDT